MNYTLSIYRSIVSFTNREMTSSSTLVLTEYVASAGGPENMDRPRMQCKSNRNQHIQTGSLKLPQWLKLEVDSISLFWTLGTYLYYLSCTPRNDKGNMIIIVPFLMFTARKLILDQEMLVYAWNRTQSMGCGSLVWRPICLANLSWIWHLWI